MKLIKTYAGSKALKHIQFDFNDKIEFKDDHSYADFYWQEQVLQ